MEEPLAEMSLVGELPPPAKRPGRAAAMTAFSALVAGAAIAGTLATRRNVNGLWYRTRRKAKVQPPKQVFAPVWTALYALMAGAGYRIWRKPSSEERSRALKLWGGQLAANAAWSWLFFGLKKPKLALADVAALLAMNATLVNAARKVDKPATAMLAPYLGWTAFAFFLNEEIVRKRQLPIR